MKPSRILLILLVVILVIALGAWAFGGPKGTDTDIVVSPRKGKFEVVVTTTGELKAKRSTKIYGPRGARQAGIWQVKINDMIPEGSVVKEGDYVATLDKSELNTKLQEVSLAMEKAESEYTSAKLDTALSLSDSRNSIVNLQFDVEEKKAEMEQSAFEAPSTRQRVQLAFEKAERAYEQAKSNYQKKVAQAVAQVKTKELELNKYQNQLHEFEEIMEQFTVTAPADGMVIYDREWDGRKVTIGSIVHMWNPVVATLPDLTEMQSVTYVNEVDIQKIRENQLVTIGLDAMAGKELTGTVSSVANIGEQRPNSDSKVFEVVITVNEQDSTLRPSMTTSNQILVASTDEALYLPLECLHALDSVSFVFKKEGATIIRQVVTPGLMNENDFEVLSGISMDDRFFISQPADTTGVGWEGK